MTWLTTEQAAAYCGYGSGGALLKRGLMMVHGPVGAVFVHLIYENQKPVGVALTVQDASFYSTIYEFRMDRVERGFEQVAYRHLRESLDLPLIPQGWDAMVELGEWNECLLDTERPAARAGRRH